MAEGESSLFDLELIKKRKLSEQEIGIVNAFSWGVQLATPEAAAEAALQLDYLCPPLEQRADAEDYLWMVWELMIDIAQSPDVKSEVHDGLMSILEDLVQGAKGDLNAWGVSASPIIQFSFTLVPTDIRHL